jgi:hypothetical protein
VRLTPLLILSLAAGCAPRLSGEATPRREIVLVGEVRVELVSWPEDANSARQVARALEVALPRASRWGGLDAPVTITIHPTHAALEEAARRPGYGWLRAWARFSSIELQSPATWGFFGASDAQVAELLAHELAHCAMYQHAATAWTWSSKGIPLWFREGMASVTAGQGARRASLDDLWRFYEEGLAADGGGDGEAGRGAARLRAARGDRPDGDPLADPEPLYRGRSEVVYGAAHHAFLFLLGRYGEGRVQESLDRMRAGAAFPAAFRESFGISEAEFSADFRRYVLWEGWRGTGGCGGECPAYTPGAPGLSRRHE